MKIKVSIDAVGHYLDALVGSYVDEHGAPTTNTDEYLPSLDNFFAHLNQRGDASYMRAALSALVRKNTLNDYLAERICRHAHLDLTAEQLRPLLTFALTQIEQGLKPPVRDDLDVEFVTTGHDRNAWLSQREPLNPGLVWFPPNTPASFKGRVESGQPCPRSGYWFTLAASNSRRYFKEGTVMPKFNSDYGDTIWQWSEDQSDPRLV